MRLSFHPLMGCDTFGRGAKLRRRAAGPLAISPDFAPTRPRLAAAREAARSFGEQMSRSQRRCNWRGTIWRKLRAPVQGAARLRGVLSVVAERGVHAKPPHEATPEDVALFVSRASSGAPAWCGRPSLPDMKTCPTSGIVAQREWRNTRARWPWPGSDLQHQALTGRGSAAARVGCPDRHPGGRRLRGHRAFRVEQYVRASCCASTFVTYCSTRMRDAPADGDHQDGGLDIQLVAQPTHGPSALGAAGPEPGHGHRARVSRHSLWATICQKSGRSSSG